MYQQVAAASQAYLDMTWKIGALYWGSSQRFAKLQSEAGVRLFTDNADKVKETLSKRNGNQSMPDWNSLYLGNANKVFDIARSYLDEVARMQTEAAQVIDDYASIMAKQAREGAENFSITNEAAEKGSAKTRKAT
ncbi:MAG: hypothetical protein ACREV9_00880 [Burkholderiales bacterium]